MKELSGQTISSAPRPGELAREVLVFQEVREQVRDLLVVREVLRFLLPDADVRLHHADLQLGRRLDRRVHLRDADHAVDDHGRDRPERRRDPAPGGPLPSDEGAEEPVDRDVREHDERRQAGDTRDLDHLGHGVEAVLPVREVPGNRNGTSHSKATNAAGAMAYSPRRVRRRSATVAQAHSRNTRPW